MSVFLSPSNQKSNTWAVGNTNEKAQAEAFADKLEALLKKQGVAVVRADSAAISARINYAKGCELIIPLHTNAYNKKVRGCRLYAYKTKKNTTAALAAKNASAMKAIQAEVDKLGMSRNVIVNYDYANWTELSNAADAGIPAVYSESIFHDSEEDCNWYFANVDRLVEAYAKGICAYLGVTYKEGAQETTVAPAPQGNSINLRTLSNGSRGEDVRALQILLKGRGCNGNMYTPDGIFGKNTLGAVKLFQQKYGLEADGIVGILTWTKLLNL